MLSWWTNMESVVALNGWTLTATLIFAVLTGIMVFLTAGKSRNLVDRLSEDLETSEGVKAAPKGPVGHSIKGQDTCQERNPGKRGHSLTFQLEVSTNHLRWDNHRP